MSGSEIHRGKLVPMSLKGVTLEERARDACRVLGYQWDDMYESWVECLRDEGYRHVYVRGDIIYEIQDTHLDEVDGFVEGTRNDDGSYDYYINYYNGGTSFTEVMDEVIVKANKGE